MSKKILSLLTNVVYLCEWYCKYLMVHPVRGLYSSTLNMELSRTNHGNGGEKGWLSEWVLVVECISRAIYSYIWHQYWCQKKCHSCLACKITSHGLMTNLNVKSSHRWEITWTANVLSNFGPKITVAKRYTPSSVLRYFLLGVEAHTLS